MKAAMRSAEKILVRNPILPNKDILIRPQSDGWKPIHFLGITLRKKEFRSVSPQRSGI